MISIFSLAHLLSFSFVIFSITTANHTLVGYLNLFRNIRHLYSHSELSFEPGLNSESILVFVQFSIFHLCLKIMLFFVNIYLGETVLISELC